MTKIFSFSTEVKKGDKGQDLFKKMYPSATVNVNDRRGDFYLPDESKVELKTDYYSLLKTPNFFMEYYSNGDKQSPGGPWQAKDYGAAYFVYLFIQDKQIFWFEVNSLVDFLNSTVHNYEVRSVKNYGWSGVGLLVPRTTLQPLLIQEPKCLQTNSK